MSFPSQTMQAGGTIEPNRFVSANTSGVREVVQADGTTLILGVSGDGAEVAPQSGSATPHATEGNPCQVRQVGSFCKVTASAAVTAGDALISDADGKAATATDSGTELIGGIALESAGAEDVLFDIMVVSYRTVN